MNLVDLELGQTPRQFRVKRLVDGDQITIGPDLTRAESLILN